MWLVVHSSHALGRGEQVARLIFNDGDTVAVLQVVESPPELWFSGLVPVGDHLVALLCRPAGRYANPYSVAYQIWRTHNGRIEAGSTLNLPTPDEAVWRIHPVLLTNDPAIPEAAMAPYTNRIPGTRVRYAMVPIPGGEFVLGTPTTEPGRQTNEGPQVRVQIDAFWMATCEVTWDLFDLFQYPDGSTSAPLQGNLDPASIVPYLPADAWAGATKPYGDYSLGMGRQGYPAIAVRPFAACRFCKWLSALTGHFYRLPTEAEWEYACRAGSTNAYSFGDDPGRLGDSAWYEDTSDFKYAKVGTRPPNRWGLYDLHGNVAELCLDQLTPDYRHLSSGARNPWTPPTRTFPTVVRGGSWDDPPDRLRSGARHGTHPSWMMTDPMLPKNPDWFSDCKTVGFRFVRPLRVPADPEELSRYWDLTVESDPP